MSTVTDSLLSIVVPLYNEEDNVVLLTQKINESLEGYNYQIVYVDDFSTDKTRIKVKEMDDKKVHLLPESTMQKENTSSPWTVTCKMIPPIFLACWNMP